MAATKQSLALNGIEPSPSTPLPRNALTIQPPKPDMGRLEAVNPQQDNTDSVSPPNGSCTVSETTIIPSPPLTSSRPAPQSPAVSRRSSQATRTTTQSRRASRLSDTSSRHLHRASLSLTPVSPGPLISATTPTPTPKPTVVTTPASPRTLTIKIRDFGFPTGDEKHRGLGPEVPKSNRPTHLIKLLNAHLRRNSSLSSASSTTTSDDEDKDEEADDPDDSFSGFKFGFGKLSWSFGKRASTVAPTVGGGGGTTTTHITSGFPSRSDLERNFTDSSSSSSLSSSSSSSDDDDEEYFDSELPPEESSASSAYPEEEDDFGDVPLPSGVYRALYAFTSEGPTEMSLTKGQLVDVVGRGGGEGWAVVRCDPATDPEGRKHALVPESYLEAVRVDEEWGEEEGEV